MKITKSFKSVFLFAALESAAVTSTFLLDYVIFDDDFKAWWHYLITFSFWYILFLFNHMRIYKGEDVEAEKRKKMNRIGKIGCIVCLAWLAFCFISVMITLLAHR